MVLLCWSAFQLMACAGLKTTDDGTLGASANSSAISGWLHWRGPHQNGTSDERGLPNHLHLDNSHQLWTYPLAGKATPVIAGDRVYAFGYRGASANFEEVLVCLDAASGALQWEYSWQGISPDTHKPGATTASPTVDAETGVVAALTSNGVLAAFSPAGTLLWQHKMNEEFITSPAVTPPMVSPTFDGDHLILQVFATEGEPQHLLQRGRFYALHKETGEPVWTGAPFAEHEHTAISSPVVGWPLGRRGLWVTTGCGHLVCVDAKDGQPLWRQQISDHTVHSSVVVDEKRLYVVYGQQVSNEGTQGGMVAFTRPSRIAVKNPSKSPLTPTIDEAWRISFDASFASPVDGGDVLFQLTSTGELMSIEKETGKIRWRNRFPEAQPHASPLFADDKLYIPMRDGQFLVLGPTLHGPMTLSKTTLKGECLSSPSTFDGRIFVHTTQAIYAFGTRSHQPEKAPAHKRD
jgi:outer membrane protein assembly factor BamB